MKLFRKLFLSAAFGLAAAGLAVPAAAQETWKLGTAAMPGSVLYDIVMKLSSTTSTPPRAAS